MEWKLTKKKRENLIIYFCSETLIFHTNIQPQLIFANFHNRRKFLQTAQKLHTRQQKAQDFAISRVFFSLHLLCRSLFFSSRGKLDFPLQLSVEDAYDGCVSVMKSQFAR